MKYTKSDAIRDFRIKNSELLSNIEKMNVTLVRKLMKTRLFN